MNQKEKKLEYRKNIQPLRSSEKKNELDRPIGFAKTIKSLKMQIDKIEIPKTKFYANIDL